MLLSCVGGCGGFSFFAWYLEVEVLRVGVLDCASFVVAFVVNGEDVKSTFAFAPSIGYCGGVFLRRCALARHAQQIFRPGRILVVVVVFRVYVDLRCSYKICR